MVSDAYGRRGGRLGRIGSALGILKRSGVDGAYR